MEFKDYEIDCTGYPKEMYVWDEDGEKQKRLVFGKSTNEFNYPYLTISGDSPEDPEYMEYAEDIIKERRSIEDGLQEGDEITKYSNSYHEIRWVLGVCGSGILLSALNNKNKASVWWTKDELIADGWELKTDYPEEEVHLSIQDISEGKGKGIDPKLIRIKE